MAQGTTPGAAPSGSAVGGPTDGSARAPEADGSQRSRLRAGLDRAGRLVCSPPVLLLALAAGLLLWALSLSRIDVSDLGGFGLAGAAPGIFWAAFGVLAAGFTASLAGRRRPDWWPAAFTVALIVVERATSAIVYPTLLYSYAWKHVDIIERLSANGGHLRLDNSLGDMAAYDQWAGFFAGNTALVKLLGVRNALSYAQWAPLVSSLLLLIPLVLIFRTFSRDWRLVWTAVWIFFLGNWVGQDYFSPQGFAFVLYLGVLALVFRNLGRTAPAGPHAVADALHPLTAPGRPQLDRRARVLWIAVLTPPIAAIAASHQLTPPMLALSLILLACFTRRYRNMPLAVLALGAAVVWDTVPAQAFLRLQVPQLLRTLGDLLANSQATTGSTPTGLGPVVGSWLDRGLSGTVALLALIGILRHPALRRTGWPLVLVAFAPMPMVAVNSYGGEMIFRVFMFALPGLAFFAAAALRPRPSPVGDRGSRMGAATLPVLLLLAAAFVPSYFGKDRLNYFPPGEVALADRMFAAAPPGSYIVAPDSDFPDSLVRYDTYPHYWIDQDNPAGITALMRDPGAVLARELAWPEPKAHAYIIFSRAQFADIGMNSLLPAGDLQRIEQSVAASPHFRVLYQNADGVVYQYVPTPVPVPAAAVKGAG